MRKVTYSMGASLDGYVMDPDGSIEWTVPSDEVFRFSIEEIKRVDVHLMGRKLYETMRYWETVDPDDLDDAEREWTTLWNPLPKVVFSHTLTEVEGDATRLATGGLAEEIERLRAEGDGDISIGGAALAAEAAALGLIDEYWVRVCPVLIGGGTPFHAPNGRRVELELVETRTFENGVVFLRHRVLR